MATTRYSKRQLMDLWVRAGGDPRKSGLMASIALAESAGDPNVVNGIGATGLWQIHPGGSQYKNPLTNARTAVQKLRTQGLGAWEAYTNGSYKRFTGSPGGKPSASPPARVSGMGRTTGRTTISGTRQEKTFDKAGYDQAVKRQTLALFLQKRRPGSVLLRTGAISTAPVDRATFEGSKTVSSSQTASTRAQAAGGGGSVGTGGGRYPLAKRGKIIGTPYAGTHTLGNWQSDRAYDIAVPVGTPMEALQGGTVVKVTKHPQGSGRFAGDQITIRGDNGNEYFYAHGAASVRAGQRVRKGQVIGRSGSANGVAHLHFAQERGNPSAHLR